MIIIIFTYFPVWLWDHDHDQHDQSTKHSHTIFRVGSNSNDDVDPKKADKDRRKSYAVKTVVSSNLTRPLPATLLPPPPILCVLKL